MAAHPPSRRPARHPRPDGLPARDREAAERARQHPAARPALADAGRARADRHLRVVGERLPVLPDRARRVRRLLPRRRRGAGSAGQDRSGARRGDAEVEGAPEHRRQDRRERQAGDRRGHRARPPGRRDGPRDPRHGPDRRLLLPVQPLRGRAGDRHARLARVLPRARPAGGPVRLHDVDLGARPRRAAVDGRRHGRRAERPPRGGGARRAQHPLRRLGSRRGGGPRHVRQLRLGPRLHLRHLPQADCRDVRLVARVGLGGVRLRGHDRRRVRADHRHAAQPVRAAPGHRAEPHRVRGRLRLALAADAAARAPLRALRRLRPDRHGHLAGRLFAGDLDVVPGAPRRRAGLRHVRQRARGHGAAADRAAPDRRHRLAGGRDHHRRRHRRHRRADRARVRPRAPGHAHRRRPWPAHRRDRGRGPALLHVLDHRRRPVRHLDRPERRHHAPVCAAHRSRHSAGTGRDRGVGDRRLRAARAAGDRMADRPVLRAAGVVRAARDGRARHLPALERRLAAGWRHSPPS